MQVNDAKFPLTTVAQRGQTDFNDFDKFVDQFDVTSDGSGIFKIQLVKDMREQNGKTQYLVKWEGVKETAWESADMVLHYGGERYVKAFLKKQAKKKSAVNHVMVLSMISKYEEEERQCKEMEVQVRRAIQEFMGKNRNKTQSCDTC